MTNYPTVGLRFRSADAVYRFHFDTGAETNFVKAAYAREGGAQLSVLTAVSYPDNEDCLFSLGLSSGVACGAGFPIVGAVRR